MDETAAATVAGVAQVFDLRALKAFAPDKRVRRMLFKTDQLWSEIACYEPGQSTVMHMHPKEEEAIFVLEGMHPRSHGGGGLGGHGRAARPDPGARVHAGAGRGAGLHAGHRLAVGHGHGHLARRRARRRLVTH